jgi:hypothetical protein
MAMRSTSRNALMMMGGALILIALFLALGPLSDGLRSDGKGVANVPSVASGPSAAAPGALSASAAGALVGASIAEASHESLGSGS